MLFDYPILGAATLTTFTNGNLGTTHTCSHLNISQHFIIKLILEKNFSLYVFYQQICEPDEKI